VREVTRGAEGPRPGHSDTSPAACIGILRSSHRVSGPAARGVRSRDRLEKDPRSGYTVSRANGGKGVGDPLSLGVIGALRPDSPGQRGCWPDK